MGEIDDMIFKTHLYVSFSALVTKFCGTCHVCGIIHVFQHEYPIPIELSPSGYNLG